MGIHVDFELDGKLAEHVAAITDGVGWYANVEEYVRDLIRKDVDAEFAKFEAFRTELQAAFAAPEDEAVDMSADEFLARARSRVA